MKITEIFVFILEIKQNDPRYKKIIMLKLHFLQRLTSYDYHTTGGMIYLCGYLCGCFNS